MKRRRRGFTVLELMLALGLGMLVVAGATALLVTLSSADRMTGASFDATVDRSVARTVLERTFARMVAAPVPLAEQEVVRPTTETPTDEFGNPLPGELPPTVEPEARVGPDRFEVRWELIAQGIEAQVLEVTLHSPPVVTQPVEDGSLLRTLDFSRVIATDEEQTRIEALRRTGRTLEPVRGVIEPVLLSDGWALQWRQIEPAREPFTLVRRVLAYEWTMLPLSMETRQWVDIMRSGYPDQFPLAARLQVTTEDGPPIDWMFECIVTVSLNEEWR